MKLGLVMIENVKSKRKKSVEFLSYIFAPKNRQGMQGLEMQSRELVCDLLATNANTKQRNTNTKQRWV